MSSPKSPDPQTIPLSRFRALLAGPRGRRKLDALLAADDPGAAVAALPATELYQIIADVGLADATELVALATPEQLRGCLDIGIWDRDQLQLEALQPWLAALVDTGYDNLAQIWEKLDPELTALVLQRFTRIYDLSLDEAPPEPEDGGERPILQTPDTFFAIEILPEDESTVALVHRLLEDLYRADPGGTLARHAIMAARSEPPAELEEMSYRWRAGRMADLGYVGYHEALEVFRPLDPSSVRIGEGTEDRFPAPETSDPEAAAAHLGLMPVPVAEGVVGASFLARALDHIDGPDELARLEAALVVLVNKVLAAARVSPGDAEAMKLGAEHAAATLSLGLESLAQGHVDRAAQALRSVSLTRLHRLGHTITLRLARMARALAPRAVAAGDSDAAVLAALRGPRPWFPRALDAAPESGVRPFASMDDVRRAAEALTRLALRIALVEALGVSLAGLAERPAPAPGAAPGPIIDDYIRTALVRATRGEPFAATPLHPSEMLAVCRDHVERGRLTPQARDAAAGGLISCLDRNQVTAGRQLLPAMLDAWLADIEERIGGLPADRAPDPRFLPGFVWAG